MHDQDKTITADTAETTAMLETHFGNEQPIVTVPYSSLRRSPLNARTKPLSGIPGLAANIRAKGLLQNLIVHEMKSTRSKQRRYGVCAGQRREAALDLRRLPASCRHRSGLARGFLAAPPGSTISFCTTHCIPQRIERHVDAFLCGLLNQFAERITFFTGGANLRPNGFDAVSYLDRLIVFQFFRQRIQPASECFPLPSCETSSTRHDSLRRTTLISY